MATWNYDRDHDLVWCRPITSREEKEAIAARLAQRLGAGDVVGVGSGSTSFVTLLALARRAAEEGLAFSAIVTSLEMERACAALDVPVLELNRARPDWSFDGADEVDPKGRLIKGRGGALFREKLVMAASRERFIVADESKRVERLGERFAVPVEVVPRAVELVESQLREAGASSCELRPADGKDGPVVTETGCLLLDVRFSGDVPAEQVLESIPGVVATGLFERWEYTTVAGG